MAATLAHTPPQQCMCNEQRGVKPQDQLDVPGMDHLSVSGSTSVKGLRDCRAFPGWHQCKHPCGSGHPDRGAHHVKGGVWYVDGWEPVWQDIAQQSQYLFIESGFSQNDRLVTEHGGRRYPSAFRTVALKVISQALRGTEQFKVQSGLCSRPSRFGGSLAIPNLDPLKRINWHFGVRRGVPDRSSKVYLEC